MIINPYIFASLDPDAQAFLSASGITDTNISLAIDTMVKNLKFYGIWTKIKGLYPLVGGTASTHKWNLKDARDLDAAYRLLFVGGWSHSSNGATPNGTNGCANTFINPASALSLNSTHISIYSRTNKSEGGIDIGCQMSGAATYLHWNYLTTTAFRGVNASPTSRAAIANTSGLLTVSRTNSTQELYYTNSTLAINFSANSTSLPNQPIYLGCRNNSGTGDFFSSKQIAFVSIGDGLTSTEVANLNTIVSAFQTALNRNV